MAALPIWMEFMKAYIAAGRTRMSRREFQAPGNIVFLAVDKTTGAVLPAETPDGISEAFIAGTQPGANAFPRPQ